LTAIPQRTHKSDFSGHPSWLICQTVLSLSLMAKKQHFKCRRNQTWS